jgi:hypothetical protein
VTRWRGARFLLLRETPAIVTWTERSLRAMRRELGSAGLRASVAPPPGGPVELGHAISLWLRLRRATCLERSLIRQRWLASRGVPHEVLIGVATANSFTAHAWLDNEDSQGHAILTRLPAPTLD